MNDLLDASIYFELQKCHLRRGRPIGGIVNGLLDVGIYF